MKRQKWLLLLLALSLGLSCAKKKEEEKEDDDDDDNDSKKKVTQVIKYGRASALSTVGADTFYNCADYKATGMTSEQRNDMYDDCEAEDGEVVERCPTQYEGSSALGKCRITSVEEAESYDLYFYYTSGVDQSEDYCENLEGLIYSTSWTSFAEIED